MALNIIGMWAAITGGTQDALANIDIPQDGVLLGIDWDVNGDLDADGEGLALELSFIATNQLGQNDVRGRISSISTNLVVLTAVGIDHISLQKWISPFQLMLFGGERLYLHSLSSAGVSGVVRCNLHFDGGAQITRRSSRR